jgi:hypothetical protein
MTSLFLDNTQVYIATTDSIKLTRENSFFTSSGDYTLDVSLPLKISQNSQFFGPWQRIEATKNNKTYSARLLINNKCILNGSAKVTNVTNEVVKIQLYGDRSDLNAIFGDKYIDEFSLPYNSSDTIINFSGRRAPSIDSLKLTNSDVGWKKFLYVPIQDETNGKVRNINSTVTRLSGTKEEYTETGYIQFNLLYCIKCVFSAMGYNCDVAAYDVEPFNHIIIANARRTPYMKTILPHWTVKTFIEELQHFFNCSFVFDSATLKVEMLPNKQIMNNTVCSIKPAEEFNVEVSDDSEAKSLATSNVLYDLSDSDYHDNDYIDKEKLENIPYKEYDNYELLTTAYNAMSTSDKGSYLLRCPTGDYCKWVYAGTETGDVKADFIQVNHFGELIRSTDDNEITNKIAPVAMADAVEVPVYAEYNSSGSMNHGSYNVKAVGKCYQVMPSMKSIEQSGYTINPQDETKVPVEEPTTIQDYIENDSSDSKYEKPDRIEVFFYDGKTQQPIDKYYVGTAVGLPVTSVFTAWNMKNFNCQEHSHWSFSLHKEKDTVTFGNLITKEVVDDKKLYTIKFVSAEIPSANNIFIIKNKKFLAQKIEINIKDGRIDQLMTGYFYEVV